MARLVGLDIGSTTIKVVEIENSGNSHHLITAGLSATPPRGLLSEATFDQVAMAEAIKKTFADARIASKSVNIALPESMVYTRVVEMPVLSEKELASAIRWEAEQYIPLPLSDAVLDYQIMDKPTKTPGSKMEVFLVAAPNSLVGKFQKIAQLAGIDLVSIETEALALVRSIMENNNPNAPVTLLVNMSAETTSLCIAKGTSVILTYVIPSGSKAFTRALSADLGIDQMQAEEYKKTYGLKKEVLSGKVGSTFKPILDNILSELKRTVSFYQSKNQDMDPIRRVILVGGTAKMPGLAVYIAEELGIETQIGDPWQKVSGAERLQSLPYDPILFAQAVGLALKPL